MNPPTDIVSELRAWRKIGSDSVMGRAADEIERLRAELDRLGPLMLRANAEIIQLRAERDKARRLYCIAFQEITENLGEKNTTESIAKEMEWDCFKEDCND